jgi:flagellar hook-associated protein 1 FlgK
MDVTANNIANAGTRGYHRQEAIFLPGMSISSGISTGGGIPQLGTGVQVESVRRAQTTYIDQQIRMGNQWLGQWSYKNNALKQIESFLTEPGNQGLSASLDRFWNSWSNLATSPESPTARADVVAKGVELSQKFTNLYSNMRSIQTTADQNIADNVAQINSLAHDIAHLNAEIRRSMGVGGQPNELMDRRDLLLDQLSQITRIEASGANAGDLIVSVSGKALVQGDIVTELAVDEGPTGWSIPVWSDDGSAVQVNGGELAAQVATRDVMVQGYIDSLNQVAQTVVERVNAIHSTGINQAGNPAGDFFVPGTDASNLAVNPLLMAAPINVATSTTGVSGGHDVADAIAKLMTEPVINGQSINSVYASLVAHIGSDSREADVRVETHIASLDQLETQRQSTAGVSMDEEMANMVKFQQSYNAAARIFTIIDEMMDTVVNRLGVS